MSAMDGDGASQSDANGNSQKKRSGGLRNFRKEVKDDAPKGQMSILRFFKGMKPDDDKTDEKDTVPESQSPRSTSPVLKSASSTSKLVRASSKESNDADGPESIEETIVKEESNSVPVKTEEEDISTQEEPIPFPIKPEKEDITIKEEPVKIETNDQHHDDDNSLKQEVSAQNGSGGLRNFRRNQEESAKDQEPRSTSPVLKSRTTPTSTPMEVSSTEDKTANSSSKIGSLAAFQHTPSSANKLVNAASTKDDPTTLEEEKSPVLQRKNSSGLGTSNGSAAPGPATLYVRVNPTNPARTKPLYIKPPSPNPADYEVDTDTEDNPQGAADTEDNPLGGVSMKTLISNASSKLSKVDIPSPDSEEDQESQDSPLIRLKPAKRVRVVVSDDDDDDDIKPPAKKAQVNGHSNSLEDNPEEVEKYILTFQSLYRRIDKMEMMDIFKRNDWNAQTTLKELEVLEKEKKTAYITTLKPPTFTEKDMKDVKKNTCTLREVRELKKNVKKEKIKAQRETWKAKAAKVEEDIEEEEEDYSFGGSKVYDSEADSDTEPDTLMTGDRKLVLQFLNEGSLGELAAIGGCSKKKAEVVIAQRPFKDWADVIDKFRRAKFISTDLLNEARTVLHVRATVQKLMKKCEKIAKDIKSLVERLVSGDEEMGISKQPSLLNPEMSLKGYQLIGLNWLVLMHEQDLNGVLADEMGLGKTVQAISYLAHIKEMEDPEQLSLIVVPSSTLDNWARELEVWCPALNVLQYHGSQEERRGIRMDIINDKLEDEPDVILTTYTMVTQCAEDRALFKKLRFHTVILDEAHMLKNMASQRYENLMKIKAGRRILLTGTPLQNNLVELMSILVFVMPQLFDSKKEELKRVFSMFPKAEDNKSKGRFEKERIDQAKRIMKPFFLRRLKCDVLKHLPTKTDEVLHVRMSERQQDIYSDMVEVLSRRARQQQLELEKMNMKKLSELEELEATGKSPKKKDDGDSCSNMVMTLRKISNHPLLTRKYYTNAKLREMSKILKKTTHQDSVLEYIVEDLSVMSDFEIHKTCYIYNAVRKHKLPEELILSSGKFEQLDEMLPRLKEEGSRVLIFSQFVIMLNILEEYMKLRKYKFLRFDGATIVSERQELIDEYTENDDIFIFLLSTRAGGLGINLTAANTVILHDIDFNPYNDKQAEDRCHRVGQTKPVHITRLVSKGTIEEGILKIAEEKLQLEKDVTGTGDEQHKKGDVVTLLKDALGLGRADGSIASPTK